MNWYLLFKALHFIGFVSWFAGIFYIVRLFVYHREAWDRNSEVDHILRKQYEIMEGRLFNIIQTPALFLTLTGGIGMLVINSTILQQPWMHVKLSLVLVLILYHYSNFRQMKKLREQPTAMSSFSFRLYNELPTLILVAVVMLAVWRNLQGLWLGFLILLSLGVLFFVVAKLYKKSREKSSFRSRF